MEQTPYATSDQGLAAYLLLKGIELLGCVPTEDASRLSFIFVDHAQRDSHVEEWLTRTGDARLCGTFFSKVKQTRRELRNALEA